MAHPTSPPPASLRWLRWAALAHAVTTFGQPVFAGVYLSGSIRGLDLHARGANIVFALGLLQLILAFITTVVARRWWPTVLSVLLVAMETAQYIAGLDGMLWLHLPLGVAVAAGAAIAAMALWILPAPERHGAGRSVADA